MYSQGAVVGNFDAGINVFTGSSVEGLSLDLVGSVQGFTRGIDAKHYGSATLSVTTNSTVTTTEDEAILVYNGGSSSTHVNTGGAVTSNQGNGIHVYNANDTTGLTLTVQNDVTAHTDAVNVNHFGMGASEITISQGNVNSSTRAGMRVYQDSNAGTLTIHANSHISGQTYGIIATSNAADDITIHVSASVSGQTQQGIYAYTQTGQNTTINANSGANIQNGITNAQGDSQLNVVGGATLSGAINLADGSDVINLMGGEVSNVTVFDGGDDTSSIDGFIDVMAFSGWNGTLSGALLVGWLGNHPDQ